VTLTFTRRNKPYTSDHLDRWSVNIFNKMPKVRKFIIPIALIKIFLVFVVMHLFFSSCEDDVLYDSDIYTDGPLFEVEATLGNEKLNFLSESESNIITVGDTIFLEIAVDDNTLFDQISQSDITLNSAEFYTQFCITDAEGQSIFPSYYALDGNIDSLGATSFYAYFDDNLSVDTTSNTLAESYARLQIAFVFDKADSYTFHFINTPNASTYTGSVDIYYHSSSLANSEMKSAYAVYLFDSSEKTLGYAPDEESDIANVLLYAGIDQAIIDFTVIEQ